MKTKKMNSYKRFGVVMLLSAAAGGVLGLVGAITLGMKGESIEQAMSAGLAGIQQLMLPMMAVITAVSVIYGEMNLRRGKMLCKKILETEDEACDRWEYEEEKNSAWGVTANILSQVLCILVLSAGYSAKYIAEDHHVSYLAVCVVFLACFAYDGVWQIRFVKTVQTAYPEKKGDPVSRKFRQKWLDSCDEAEKEVIYQSAYKSYIQINTCIPVLLVITMVGQMFFETGILAIVMVAVIWLIVTVSYLRSCVKLKKAKLTR